MSSEPHLFRGNRKFRYAMVNLVARVVLLAALALPSADIHGLASSEVSSPSAIAVTPGDFDFDGEVTRADAVLFYRVLRDPRPFLAEHAHLTVEQTLALGDLDGDQRINQADLNLLVGQLRTTGRWPPPERSHPLAQIGVSPQRSAGGGQVYRSRTSTAEVGASGGRSSIGGSGGASTPSSGSGGGDPAGAPSANAAIDGGAPAASVAGSASLMQPATLTQTTDPDDPAVTSSPVGPEVAAAVLRSPLRSSNGTSGRTPSGGGAIIVRGGNDSTSTIEPAADANGASPAEPGPAGPQQTEGPGEQFLVFDALSHDGKPRLSELHGLRPLRIVYARELWGSHEAQVEPRENAVKAVARRLSPHNLVCIDIEHWPVHNAPDADIDESIRKLIQVVQWMREAAPAGTSFGYYGVLPVRDFWNPVSEHRGRGDEQSLAAWKAANKRLARIADHVDIIFPSLYTFYENPDAWVVYAKANIAQARTYGKPVYPFLWFDYHNSNRSLSGQQIDKQFWSTQLQTVRELADGVVIWGGWRQQWDEEAPWWQATVEFIEGTDQAVAGER